MGAKLPGWLLGIDDSKLLTPRNRQRLARRILIEAAAVGVGIVSNEEIDQENISRASFLAMRKAVANLGISPEILLVDGYGIKDYPFPQRGVVQGDKKSLSIAAASIVAKVLRDEMMACLDRVFEGYSLGRNKGYGTREHFRALEALGCTSFHRRSFNLKS
jgi:ribonuclease HII